jgi:hypothetical protein
MYWNSIRNAAGLVDRHVSSKDGRKCFLFLFFLDDFRWPNTINSIEFGAEKSEVAFDIAAQDPCAETIDARVLRAFCTNWSYS